MFRRISTLVMLLLLIGLLPVAVSAQGGGNRAALVVRAGDGSVQTKCVSFSESAISGEELLTRSGMTVVINSNAGLGGAVCSINGYGCAYPSQDCFCKCQGVKCEYWAYYHWVGECLAVFAGRRHRLSGEERGVGGLVVGAGQLQLRHDPADGQVRGYLHLAHRHTDRRPYHPGRPRRTPRPPTVHRSPYQRSRHPPA